MDPRFREDDVKNPSFLRRQESIGVSINPTNQLPAAANQTVNCNSASRA
jgi:hypothetical protein